MKNLLLFLVLLAIPLMQAYAVTPEEEYEVIYEKKGPIKYYYIESEVNIEKDNISQIYAESYGKLMKFIEENGIAMAGVPISISTKWEPPLWGFRAAIPVKNNAKKGNDDIMADEIKETYVAKTVYVGPYEGSESAYNAIMEFIEENGYEESGWPWEEYANDPQTTPEDELKTIIYFPVTKEE